MNFRADATVLLLASLERKCEPLGQPAKLWAENSSLDKMARRCHRGNSIQMVMAMAVLKYGG